MAKQSYYIPAQRQYIAPEQQNKELESPMWAMGNIGQTVPDVDPSGRLRNMVQTVQAAIRGGSGTIQIVMAGGRPSEGGGLHKQGKDVREAVRELVKANQIRAVGIECPTSLNNLSGLNRRTNSIDEETRQEHLDEVKSAIKFAGEVFNGGGTDVVSWEFPRGLGDELVGGKEKNIFKSQEQETKTNDVYFVDTRSGKLVPIPVKEGIPLKVKVRNPQTGVEEEKWDNWDWDKFKEEAKRLRPNEPDYAYELFKERHFETRTVIAKAEADRRRKAVNEMKETSDYRNAQLKGFSQAQMSADEKQAVESVQLQENYITQEERIERENQRQILSLQPLHVEAKKKTIRSYAEAGLFAREEQMRLELGGKKLDRPLYVGPEIGWPHSYGGHPDEFIAIVQESRKEMERMLVEKQGLSQKDAQKEAQTHIKGCFDTGHMGMWLKHFNPKQPDDKPPLSEEERMKQFEKWYLEKVEKIAKANVIGGIQVVDSHGAEHAHLPAGQGIYPIKKALEIFKKNGFNGYIVSEGHEEDKWEEGRIRTQTWKALGSPIASGYSPAPRFGQIQNSYFGRMYSPKNMFGSYTPPFGEYRPWSEIPFE